MVVEIGAHSTLSGPIRQILKAAEKGEMPYASCLKRNLSAVDTMQDTACDLIKRGCPVNLREVNQFSTSQSSSPVSHRILGITPRNTG